MKYIYIIVLSLVCALSSYAQVPKTFNYQVLLPGDLRSLSAIEVDVELLLGSAEGAVIYSETQQLHPSDLGAISIKVGNQNNNDGVFADIPWGQNEIFIRIKTGSQTISTSLIPAVPYACTATTVGAVEQMDYENVTNGPDFIAWDMNVNDDFSGSYSDLKNKPEKYFDGDYQSLHNQPIVKTDEEALKLNHLSANSAANINTILSDIAENDNKISSPDFGHEASNIANANRLWKKENILYHPTLATINNPAPKFKTKTALSVYEGIKFHGAAPSEKLAGTLFYDAADNNGTFCYYDENLNLHRLPTTEDGSLLPGKYQVILDDAIIQNLIIGDDANIRYNPEDNIMCFVENILRVKFFDTSTTASFPTNDWVMGFNEIEVGEQNCFYIDDESNGTTPFYISSESIMNELFISEDGKVGLDTNMPTHQLELKGSVEIMQDPDGEKHFFIGDASQLSGIDLINGSSQTSNEGSTTITADHNKDGVGDIEFIVNDAEALRIKNNGTVTNTNYDGTQKLFIEGTTGMESVRAERLNVTGTKIISVTKVDDVPELTIENANTYLISSSTTLKANSTEKLLLNFVNTSTTDITITVPNQWQNQTYSIEGYGKLILEFNGYSFIPIQ